MKCINCFREIDDSLKFCPKCGFKQPDDREAYELEHPELADALPEDEILEKLEHASIVPRTAVSREEFVESIANDPHHESIIKMVDEGLEKFELSEKSDRERWLAKCLELVGDKQGFYPYFIRLLSQKYEMARDLLFNQASYGMGFSREADDEMPPELPELPPPLPARNTLPTLDSHEGGMSYNTGYIQPAPAMPPFTDGSGTSVVCPICHNHLSPGTTECPFCHQLLDWSDADASTHKPGNEENENNYMWILPVAIIAVLILIICFAAAQCDSASNKRHYLDESYPVSEIEQEAASVMEEVPAQVEEDYHDYPVIEADDYNEYDVYDEPADEYDTYEDDEYEYDYDDGDDYYYRY